ncbi:MAG: UvrB/UvrC motif-containing protein [Candidatus Omnitrophota bacterium]
MKCEVCKQKKATVHLTELIDGKVTELHICEGCAKEKSLQMEQQFGLADLLAGLSDFNQSPAKEKEEPQKTAACEHCSMSYEDFRKYGRLGCSECYESFRDQLTTLLKKIHGSNRHAGKRPRRYVQSVKQNGDDLKDLRKQLKQAVVREDYEQAAILRDKLKDLEQREKNHES